jgi:hypothetical protein
MQGKVNLHTLFLFVLFYFGVSFYFYSYMHAMFGNVS